MKNYADAIKFYSEAIDENPTDHTLYGNRSASYHNMRLFDKALEDGEICVHLSPSWAKGYQRKAMALHGLDRLQEAFLTFEEALKLDPSSSQIQQGISAVMKSQQLKVQANQQNGIVGPKIALGEYQSMGAMLSSPEAKQKLESNPRIAEYFHDEKFKEMWQ